MRFERTRMLFMALTGLVIAVLAAGISAPPVQAQDGVPCGETVTVQEGDTLIGIAAACNTTVNALLQANPSIDPRALAIGTVLTIPAGEQAGSAAVALAIAPVAGPPGTQVHVIANNLAPNATLDIGIGRPDSEYDIIAQTTSDSFGTLDQFITVPEFIGADDWLVVVTNPATGTELFSSVQEPTVAIAPTQGVPGTAVQVIANHFPPNTEVTLGVGPWRSEFDVQQRLVTNDRGTVQAPVTIPEYAAADERWVVVVTTIDNAVTAQSALFHVSAVPGPVPSATPASPDVPVTTPVPGDGSAPVFDRTNITLIALEDDGEFGPALACGDSAVTVEIVIEPTAAPLTAALENLLAVREEFYGQSGLYNALHASDLALESLDLQDGHATINLSGIVRETRLCDGLRIKAQIMQTALQFDTVTSASLFINGNQW